MTGYDERLRQLLLLAEGKDHARAVLADLEKQRRGLEKKTADLNYARMNEQEDVDRLETGSIRSLVLSLLGRKEERLETERAELAAAILKYDAAKRELDEIIALEAERRAEFNRCDRAMEEYEKLLSQKADFLGSLGGADGEEILRLRREIARREALCAELSEALNEGRMAESVAESVIESLKSADTWGTFDLFGGGLISDLAKYSAMDEAKQRIERLQHQLRRFRAELADVSLDMDADMESGSLFRFADFFFDDIFTAVSALNRIERTRTMVREAIRKIRDSLRELERRLGSEKAALHIAQEQFRTKVIQTKA